MYSIVFQSCSMGGKRTGWRLKRPNSTPEQMNAYVKLNALRMARGGANAQQHSQKSATRQIRKIYGAVDQAPASR